MPVLFLAIDGFVYYYVLRDKNVERVFPMWKLKNNWHWNVIKKCHIGDEMLGLLGPAR